MMSAFFAKNQRFLAKIIPLLIAIVWELCWRFFSSVFSFCKIQGYCQWKQKFYRLCLQKLASGLTLTLQFSSMITLSNSFHVVLFPLSSLVTGPVSCQYHRCFWGYDNFLLQGIDQKSWNGKYPCLSFSQYLRTGMS